MLDDEHPQWIPPRPWDFDLEHSETFPDRTPPPAIALMYARTTLAESDAARSERRRLWRVRRVLRAGYFFALACLILLELAAVLTLGAGGALRVLRF